MGQGGVIMEQANTIEQYLRILEKYSQDFNIFFRGQAAKYTSINSSISRDFGHLTNEHQMYQEAFQMMEHEFESLTYPIERLAKMQHYEIPTRLIDVTIDPLTALFFAVENVEDSSDGNIFIYIQPSKTMNNKTVRLLALLATLSNYNLSNIEKTFYKTYNEPISEKEIIKFAKETAFVAFTDKLKDTNPRLHNQKGTFVICGNEVQNNDIQKQVKALDSIKPNLIIRIPYEHKQAIKRELDQRHLINKATIYPELPSTASYIKEKYREQNISIDGTYSVMEIDDKASYPGVKRLSLKITLNKLLRIEDIHEVAKSQINKYMSTYDVIFVFIAKNSEDYIMYNWILRVLWLNPSNNHITMSPLSNTDGTGYSWVEGKSYSVLADYHSKYVFKDDKFLFICNKKVYDELYSIYEKLLKSFTSDHFEDFSENVLKYEDKIRKDSLVLGDFGVSRNKEFDDYLNKFTDFALMLDNLPTWLKKDHLDSRKKLYQIRNCFKDLQESVNYIDYHYPKWRKNLGITSTDYEEVDPYNLPKEPRYQFEPTIPINPNGLKVDFSVEIVQNEDQTLSIYGKTNLYDNASLVLSLRKENGQLTGGNKATVHNGKFDFGRFSIKGNGYNPGIYFAQITVSIPDTQPKKFREKAGSEYENLIGPYVRRDGTAPILEYKKEFKVEVVV